MQFLSVLTIEQVSGNLTFTMRTLRLCGIACGKRVEVFCAIPSTSLCQIFVGPIMLMLFQKFLIYHFIVVLRAFTPDY